MHFGNGTTGFPYGNVFRYTTIALSCQASCAEWSWEATLPVSSFAVDQGI